MLQANKKGEKGPFWRSTNLLTFGFYQTVLEPEDLLAELNTFPEVSANQG